MPVTQPAESEAAGAVHDEYTKPDSEVHLSFSPYAWLTSFSGDISVRGAEIDLSRGFFDILDDADSVFGFMGAIDLEVNHFVFQVNGSWVTLEQSKRKGVFRNGRVEADVDLDAGVFEFFGGYRFLDSPLSDAPESQGRFKLDGYVGGRVTAIDIDTTLSAKVAIPLPGDNELTAKKSEDRSQSNEWIEPMVGLRTIIKLDDHWLIQVRGDVGGFGIDGSKFSWQAVGVIGYEWHFDGWSLGLFGGYRALGQDLASGDLEWDVITHGPLLGGTLVFSF